MVLEKEMGTKEEKGKSMLYRAAAEINEKISQT